ncbi:EGF-like domain-containing protein [Pycnococcus provasolii]
MPPKLEVLGGGGGLHIAVQVGGVAHDSLKVTNQGTSLLVWELRQVSGFSTGLHPSAKHGVLRGSSSLTLNITANATEMLIVLYMPASFGFPGAFPIDVRVKNVLDSMNGEDKWGRFLEVFSVDK